jgi:phenylacetate-CoA ligase
MSTAKKSLDLYQKTPHWIQSVCSSAYGMRKLMVERNGVFKRFLKSLRESERYTTAKLREMQDEKLRLLVVHAYQNVPYYQRVFRQRELTPKDIACAEDLRKLPLLDKALINKHMDDLVARNADRSKMLWNHSSGTTGRPFGMYVDRTVEDMWNALQFRHRGWGGYFYDSLRVTFGGHVVVPFEVKRPPFWRYNLPGRQVHFSTFHLSEENLPHYVHRLQSLGAQVMDGYPSAVYILARYMVREGIQVPLKAVFVASEPLYEHQRAAMEKAFGCQVFNYYGLAERSCSSGECEKHSGNHHFMEESIVEILDGNGRSVPDGQSGEIVGTSLVNFTMPLLRYRTGDICAFRTDDCTCGRGLKLMTPVQTKKEDIITTPDGRYISASVLTHPLKPLHGIEKTQIVQEDLTHFVVKLVQGDSKISAQELNQLVSAMQDRLGKEAKIEVDFVDDIPRTAAGKFRFVVSKVPYQEKHQAATKQP